MVLFEAPYQHLEYHAAHHVLISQWYGYCTSQEYRDASNRFLHYVETMSIHCAISDRRLLPPISPEDAHWTSSVFLENFCQLPLHRFAIIKSFSSSAGRQLQNFIHNKERPLPFETKVFEDLTSAYEWVTMPEVV